jgi:hypothetical protein
MVVCLKRGFMNIVRERIQARAELARLRLAIMGRDTSPTDEELEALREIAWPKTNEDS